MRKYMPKLSVFFFCTDSGNEPVREWLSGLAKVDKKIIGEDIKTVQFGWPLGMPLVASLGDGLWEIRSKLTNKSIARMIFFMDENGMVLVNGFIKKTQKTPKKELDLARQRKRQYQLIILNEACYEK
jgi:phage-related protein